MKLKRKNTARGFTRYSFEDRSGAECSIQKSSLAFEDAIWFGPDDAQPRILASQAAAHGVQTSSDCGWVPYPVPDAVMLRTRMHLSREQVWQLIPILQHFAITGELPE